MAIGKWQDGRLHERARTLGFFVLVAMVIIHLYRVSPGVAERGERTVSASMEDPVGAKRTPVEVGNFLQRLDASQKRIELALGKLDTASRALDSEREVFQSRLEGEGASLRDGLERSLADVAAVKAAAKVNSARLGLIELDVEFPSERGKRLMIEPTVQLKGNGTVGSAVLVYSGPFAGDYSSGRYCNLALTAFHVVAEVLGNRLERSIDAVKLFSPAVAETHSALSARLVAYDEAKDIALLYLDTSQQLPGSARLKTESLLEQLDIFSPACAVGCPLGSSPVATMGQITAMGKDVDGEKFWMINAPTYFGNSGGGVYSVPDCNLIGIFSMIYTYGKTKPQLVPHMGLFLPLQTIRGWLDREGWGFVHEGSPVPSAAWEKLGYSPKKGLPVDKNGR